MKLNPNFTYDFRSSYNYLLYKLEIKKNAYIIAEALQTFMQPPWFLLSDNLYKIIHCDKDWIKNRQHLVSNWNRWN